MIGYHCGKKLVTQDFRKGQREGKHTWKCAICNRTFTQQTRKAVQKVVDRA